MTTAIYAIQPTDGDGLTAAPVATIDADGPSAGCTAMTTVAAGGTTFLYAYDARAGSTAVFALTASAPYLQPVGAVADLSAHVYDSLTSFVLGNQPYVMAYEREHGHMAFYPIAADGSTGAPYDFYFARNTPTTGFTAVGVYSSAGQIVCTGYAADTGTVANFVLSVTPTSAAGTPPLLAQNVWFHQWAKGWTNFAFFQLGGSNFFFKINTMKLNVNIDHMQDDPSRGSLEVGSFLQDQLPEALEVTAAAIVPWATGEPRLITYTGSTGVATIRRIHADCQGWSTLTTFEPGPGAAHIRPYRIGDASFVLVH